MTLGAIPRATYRLQLNRDFTFVQAAKIVPYLAGLGISHAYISPCLKARPGSMHGYDIVDHNSLNPEIGSPEEFDRFVNRLHEHEMGLILDIVPNHMGVMGADNAWWLDVLENGEASIYAHFFDIDWHPLKDELEGKVLLPVLHDHYGTVLESGELKIVFNEKRGQFDVQYRNHCFPVNPREYPRILQQCAVPATSPLGEQDQNLLEFQSVITAFSHLPRRQDITTDGIAERNRDKEIHKRRLAELCARSPQITACILKSIDAINGTASNPASFEQLHELIKVQAFRLANWRVAADDINYRRFFDTNDLAGICMENDAVFEATHRLILNFIAEGKVDGLRLDHPDGLYDPAGYFERLRSGIRQATHGSEAHPESGRYVVIEKILSGKEKLRSDWPVCGTTGYDFSNLVNGLFVDPSAAKQFEKIYRNFIGDDTSYDEIAYQCRNLTIRNALASELNVLANQLSRIALSKRHTCDFTLNSLRDALTEIVASFPVYRTYVTVDGPSVTDERFIRAAVSLAKWRSPAADTSVFDFVENVLLTRIAEGQDPAYRRTVTAFAMKFQQFTSPVMAKGIEDTAFYRYNRLASLNDVGSDPHRFGVTPGEFHATNSGRLRDWPYTMSATSTHDSKRSEDVRARINVLSEIPALWRLQLRGWRRMNRGYRKIDKQAGAPTRNDEYLLYQTLIGAWPAGELKTESEWKVFRERIENYMLKAIREAKENTSWINRNEDYETAVLSFVRALVNPDARFLSEFFPFQRRIARIGLWNSLSQTLLKLCCPGVPDIYQGNELFDFSLVDPDNRRPIDYASRQEAFATTRELDEASPESLAVQVLNTASDGRLKMYTIWKALCLRKRSPEIFQQGNYLPLEAEGARSKHVVAFFRRTMSNTLLVLVPRLIAGLVGEKDIPPVGPEVWQDTFLTLPSGTFPKSFRNAFTGSVLDLNNSGGRVAVSRLLAEFPVALFSD
jgi:(1->4)-alpha-D-glucan 1-alpha-D-glucosylmutase